MDKQSHILAEIIAFHGGNFLIKDGDCASAFKLSWAFGKAALKLIEEVHMNALKQARDVIKVGSVFMRIGRFDEIPFDYDVEWFHVYKMNKRYIFLQSIEWDAKGFYDKESRQSFLYTRPVLKVRNGKQKNIRIEYDDIKTKEITFEGPRNRDKFKYLRVDRDSDEYQKVRVYPSIPGRFKIKWESK